MSPIELLQRHVIELRRDFGKSMEMYKNGQISFEIHETHRRNIIPLIKEYEQAIQKLIE